MKLTDEIDEQFTLAPGGRYYFDLSAMDIPGTVNSNLPDSTLHYVPFTYAGTVDAYSMENETDTHLLETITVMKEKALVLHQLTMNGIRSIRSQPIISKTGIKCALSARI